MVSRGLSHRLRVGFDRSGSAQERKFCQLKVAIGLECLTYLLGSLDDLDVELLELVLETPSLLQPQLWEQSVQVVPIVCRPDQRWSPVFPTWIVLTRLSLIQCHTRVLQQTVSICLLENFIRDTNQLSSAGVLIPSLRASRADRS